MCPPSRAAADHQRAVRVFAELTATRGKLGPRDRRDLTERHDLTVRVVDRGTDHPPAILEYEHIANVFARPQRRGARRPQLDDLGRPPLSELWEGRIVLRAVEDHLVTAVGQARPAVWNVQDVIRPRSLKPARTERARSFREIGPVLAPW